MWDFGDLARAMLKSGSEMFANSNAASVYDSTLTSVGGDAHTTTYDTAAESIQAGVNHVGRDQNFYNVAAAGSDTADKMRGTAVGIMINGKGASVKLLKDNKFTITAANPHGLIEDGESNTIVLGEGNTFTLRQVG